MSKPKQRLSLLSFVAAWQQYALAADATGQLCFPSSTAHLTNVLMVGEQAHSNHRKQGLALVYDEVARKRWSDKAYKGVSGFCVNKAALTVDENVLKEAERLYDQRGLRKGAGKGDKGGKGGFANNRSGGSGFKRGGQQHEEERSTKRPRDGR